MTNTLSPFDWQGEPSQVKFPKRRPHKKGVMPLNVALALDRSTCVAQMDANGNVIKSYPSIASASRDLGVNKNSITLCLKGKQKSAGGFVFKARPRRGVEE